VDLGGGQANAGAGPAKAGVRGRADARQSLAGNGRRTKKQRLATVRPPRACHVLEKSITYFLDNTREYLFIL